MANHTITIQVDEGGNFTYQPATRKVVVPNVQHPDETVQWQYADGLFAVHFPRSPFRKVVIHGNGLTVTSEAQVRKEAAPGVYQYAVAVVRETSEGDKVFIDACPEVIIECG